MANKPWLGLAGLTIVTLVSLPVKTTPAWSHVTAKTTSAWSHVTAKTTSAWSDVTAKTTPAWSHVTAKTAAPARMAPPLMTRIRVPAAFRLTRVAVPAAVADPVKVRSKRIAYAVRMGGGDAMRRLRTAGLGWHASGSCTDRAKPWCTSLQSIRYGTLAKTIELKRRSGCRVTITGGTETGHAKGMYSHRNGYKVDLKHNRCLDGYIKQRFPLYKTRGDGAPLYRSPQSDLYAREASHWDILFR